MLKFGAWSFPGAWGLEFGALPDSGRCHPSLRFKKLAGTESIWSVRITAQYRAIGERRGDMISWVWIGTHNEFDKLFG